MDLLLLKGRWRDIFWNKPTVDSKIQLLSGWPLFLWLKFLYSFTDVSTPSFWSGVHSLCTWFLLEPQFVNLNSKQLFHSRSLLDWSQLVPCVFLFLQLILWCIIFVMYLKIFFVSLLLHIFFKGIHKLVFFYLSYL